jgi:hypothetical protein
MNTPCFLIDKLSTHLPLKSNSLIDELCLSSVGKFDRVLNFVPSLVLGPMKSKWYYRYELDIIDKGPRGT